jgi:LacI family transcriptional regulator
MPKATMRTIARRAGVSIMSVSLALRGRPGVSTETRQRILALAEELGYQPNAVASELMEKVRHFREHGTTETIAFLNTFRDPELYHRFPILVAFIEGARQRAADYGYRLEEFRVFAPASRPESISRILKARGIRGVLLGPRWIDEPEIDLDWDSFSCVRVGEAVTHPTLPRVCNHHTHTMRLALLNLTRLGYRRILVCDSRLFDRVRGFGFRLGVDLFHHEHPHLPRCLIYEHEHWVPADFARAFEQLQPDAVVSHGTQFGDWLAERAAQGAPHCGYANLGLSPDREWSGIDQHPLLIGEHSMDLLRVLLLHDSRGGGPNAQLLLVEGEWVDGATTRQVGPAPEGLT